MHRKRKFTFACMVILSSIWVGQNACLRAAPRGKRQLPQATSFENDIRPLLQAKCFKCHSGAKVKGELDLSTSQGILKGGESGPVTSPGKPEESLLFEKIHNGSMPPDKKSRLNEAEIELVRRWILAGAKISGDDVSSNMQNSLSQHDVIPIMLRHCTACHGLRRAEAGLDLRTRAGMLRGGKSGPAIVPGKPAESLLIKRIAVDQMPPPERLVEASVKPVAKADFDVLMKWIEAGAPEAAIRPDIATTDPDPLVSDKSRDFWAFRPPQPQTPPTVQHVSQVRNVIDRFILKKLEDKGLTLAPEAAPITLMRRAYFDLTGLPPTQAEVQAFLGDKSPDAYERLIDRLLESPHYGERWGTYWLDLAGYADSEGKREQDLPRPFAWRYRDYVIRSFNVDKPYDRFLLEQLAGDELANYENASTITSEIYDNLVATAFLRMAPDPTWANITGYAPDRLEVIADEMDILGSAVLGLTMKCARCHDHKYDPIPQRDYYRLLATFKGAYDEFDWLKPDVHSGIGPVSQDVGGGRLLSCVTTTERKQWEAGNAKIKEEINALHATINQKTTKLSAKHLDTELAKLPEVLRADLRTMLRVPAEKRDAVQSYLAGKFEKQLLVSVASLKAADPVFKKECDSADARTRELQARIVPEPKIQALWDRGEPSPTYIYRRGDPLNSGRLVGPGVPSVLTDGKTPFEVKQPWPSAKKTGRRLAFARWVTDPSQPLTGRVLVNRLWRLHFGKGIVKSLDNFGRNGLAPTHPELLDWLAREFVQKKWSMKAMHRLMMTSAVYRQSSAVTPELETADLENALYSRTPLLRLDAEALYDTMLFVSGRLDETPFGPADAVKVRPDGLVTPVPTNRGWRRLIYVEHLRKTLPTHLENFDYPQMNPNCVERHESSVVLQALQLSNTGMVYELAEQFAKRVRGQAGDDPVVQINQVYQLALSRPPTEEEKRIGVDALSELTREWAKNLGKSGKSGDESGELRALTTYCHAIMNSAAFLYVD